MDNLNTEIARMLGRQSPQLKQEWEKHTPIRRSNGFNQDLVEANRYFRTQLGLLGVNTIHARETLTGGQTKAEWLEGFQERVLPIIAQHGLPEWKGN